MSRQVQYKYKPAVILLLLAAVFFGWASHSSKKQETEEVTMKPKTSQPVRPEARISLILKDLVETHPSPQISRDLNHLVTSGKVFLNFQPAMSPGAVATVMWVNTPSHGQVLTLVTPAEWLIDPTTSREMKQLVIFHEYQHIRQQLDQTVPRELAFGANTAAIAQMSETDLEQWFEAEYEAYAAESELAISLGWQKEFALCEIYASQGRAGLRRVMADMFSAMPVYSRHAATLRRIAAR